MKKRLLTYFMALTMVVSLLPTTALANDTEEIIVNDVTWGNDVAEEEEDFQVYWTYVTNEDGSVTAIENELLTDEDKERMASLATVSSTSSTNSFGLTEAAQDTSGLDPYGAGDGGANINPFHELLVDSIASSTTTLSVFDAGEASGNYWNKTDVGASFSYERDVAYSRVVAFDATGSGKDNYVARVSMTKYGKTHYLDVYEIDEDGDGYLRASVGLGSISLSDKIEVWETGSFLDITAGDFDGDGKDEIAVTNLANFLSDDASAKSKAGNQGDLVLIYGYSSNSLSLEESINLNNYVINYGASLTGATSLAETKFPVISLTAGTLFADNDVADDLIVSISTNDETTNFTNVSNVTGRVLVYSSEGSDSISTTPTVVQEYKTLESIATGPFQYTYFVPRNISTTIGDIDGDESPDLVVASEASIFVMTEGTATGGDASYQVYKGIYDAGSVNRNYITAYATSGTSALSSKTGGEWAQHTSVAQLLGDTDYIQEPVALAAYAYNGSLDCDYVYLEGNTFTYNSSGLTFDWVGSDARPTTDWGSAKDRKWISDAVAGNIFHNSLGNEAIIHTYGMRSSNDTSEYLFDAAYLYYDGTSWDKDCDEFPYYVKYDASLSLALVDYDEDGLIVKKNPDKSTDYYFTDPDILAVLQAAPRFAELDELDGNYPTDGSTALSNSKTSGTEVSNGLTLSAGVSVGFEYEAQLWGVGPAIGAGHSLTATGSFSSSWIKSTETTSTITYTSESNADRLVLSMIPYVRYHYLMWVPEFQLMSQAEYNTYKSNYEYYIGLANGLAADLGASAGYGSSTKDAQYIEYLTLAVDAYDEYTAMDSLMNQGYTYDQVVDGMWQEYEISIPSTPITAIMTVTSFDKVAASMGWDKIYDNVLPYGYAVGYPTTYATSTNGLNDWGAAADDYSSNIAGGGSTTQALEAMESSTTSLTYGAEVTYEVSVIVLGVTGSISTSIGYEGGYAWTDGTGVAYEGTVQNVPTGGEAYSFDWLFGSYTAPFKADADEDEYDVLVLGYILDNVDAPPSVPSNFEVSDATTDSLTLTWDIGYIPASTYTIYRETSSGSYVLAVVDGSETSYTNTGLDEGTEYSYSIKATDSLG